MWIFTSASDVVVTEAAKYTNMLTLIDEQGYTVAASHQSSLEGNRKKISIIPYQPLKTECCL
jgi:hypothetical protein